MGNERIYIQSRFVSKKGWLTYSGVGGVPKTTEEFIDLLNKISDAGYIAYTLSLENEQYMH